MLPEITIGGTGFAAMSRLLGVIAEAVGDLTGIWREVVHPRILSHMQAQFESAGRAGGKPWAGYGAEPQYAAYKEEMVGHLQPLIWEIGGFELLRPSLVNASDPLHHVVITPSKIEVGTLVPYAARLTVGGTGPFRERYPGRDIMAMDDATKKQLITDVQRAITSQASIGGARANL